MAWKNRLVQASKRNDHEARRRFGETSQNELAADADFHKKVLSKDEADEAHFWSNGYVNEQNCRIRSVGNSNAIEQ